MPPKDSLSLQQRVHGLLQKRPEARAICFYDRHRQVRWLSLEEFCRRAAVHGEALQRRGLAGGDVCVLNLPSDETSTTILLGVLLIGAIPLLVAPPVVRGQHSNLADVLARVAGEADARLVVIDGDSPGPASTAGLPGDVQPAYRSESPDPLSRLLLTSGGAAPTRSAPGFPSLARPGRGGSDFDPVTRDFRSGTQTAPPQVTTDRLMADLASGVDRDGRGRVTVPEVFPAVTAVAAMQLTSGTTGFPRICVWDQGAVLAALDGMAVAMHLRPRQDVCLNWTPLYHDMGLVNNFLLALIQGVPLVMIPTMEFLRRPALWLQGLSDTGTTVTWSPNFGFALVAKRVREAALDGVRLDRVRAFWNAAERIHLNTMQSFHARFERLGVSWSDLKTNFGCAENVGGATFSDVDGPCLVERLDAAVFSREGRAVCVPEMPHSELSIHSDPSTTPSLATVPSAPTAPKGPTAPTFSVVGVGRGAPGLEVEIVDTDGKRLEDGRIGEVALRTPSRMRGYLGDDEATAAALDGERLRTGDLGYLRAGELFWVGRAGERINLYGEKYDPSDFESVLLSVEGLREGCFAVFGIDDAAIGTQRLVILSEVRDIDAKVLQEIAETVCRRVVEEVGPAVSELLLLAPGSMSKTSSGKRRHTFYRWLHESGSVEFVFRMGGE